jgi:hypothetical protein
MLEEESQAAVNAKNLRGNSKGFGASGNMIINKDTGDYEPMEGYDSGSDASTKLITLAPKGSTVKGTGDEVTVEIGSPEYKQYLSEGYIDTSKLPGPDRSQDIDVRVDAKNIEDQNKSRNKLAADQAGPILEKGRQSADVLKQTAMLRSQLESGNFDSGFLSTFRGFLGTAGQYLGMDDQLLADLRQNPNDFNILTSVTQNLVASTATMLQASGQLSRAELELYKASGANMSQTAQGMYAVNEITASIADWNVRRSEKLTELYAQMPEAGTNDMQVINEIQKWERDNPLAVDVKTLDRIKRHAKIVEMGKKAKDIKSAWSPEKGKNTASVGNVYRYRGGLYVYKGDTVVDGKVVPDLRMAK